MGLMTLRNIGSLAALGFGSLSGAVSVAQEALVNAPVAPEAIYVARTGANVGLSVIDLNGFGQGTGDPDFDPTGQVLSEHFTKFPNNPNVAFQGNFMFPPLAPGSLTRDGGSSGVFSLTKNTDLEDVLISRGEIGRVVDMMLGHPLDRVYNNSLATCTFGGGSACASDSLQVVQVGSTNGISLVPVSSGVPTLNLVIGKGNPISFAPHPNPPRLLALPTCPPSTLLGEEPTSVDNFLGANGLPALANLLVPGDPFGQPSLGVGPGGLLASQPNSFFVGPSQPTTQAAGCESYQIRQQVGHYLYALDGKHSEIVVLNSNRFTVLDRIAVSDATELAMDPNMELLAISNRSADTVTFVDISPVSSTFHQIVKITNVGDAPTGIAWQPDNEDLLVCNEGSNDVSILSGFNLEVRKTVKRGLRGPFAIAITGRQNPYGGQRNVYFAFILDRTGRISVFESGPGGVNGWGFDDIVAQAPFLLKRPAAMQLDPTSLDGAVWVAHSGQLDMNGQATALTGGALSRVALEFSQLGVIPLQGGEAPSLRGAEIKLSTSIGSNVLTGTPTDLAFDNLVNLGALPNLINPFSSGFPAQINGKHPVRRLGSNFLPTNQSRYLLATVRGATTEASFVDVIDLETNERIDTNPYQPGVNSIPASGAIGVMDYFRQ